MQDYGNSVAASVWDDFFHLVPGDPAAPENRYTQNTFDYNHHHHGADRMESRAGLDNLDDRKVPEDNLRGFALMISKLLFRLAQI